MNSRIPFGIFLAVALIQLSIPAQMIWRHERSLTKGRAYRFRTAPVDPYDAFRGRFVALRFEQEKAPWKDRQPARRGQSVYALIEEGSDGFAHFSGATAHKPVAGDYIVAHVSWPEANNTVHLILPFDRFYMEETLAPAAERAYREHNSRSNQNASAVVRVLNGLGVIENVFVANKPIGEFIRDAKR
ncbi:MAG TPA: GDYXXLXY domain-containing protein [Verrucomicrobiae bacterium]|nr:GDYXXLXY domain-containing protein [Verrucomicrobiae bacterium]